MVVTSRPSSSAVFTSIIEHTRGANRARDNGCWRQLFPPHSFKRYMKDRENRFRVIGRLETETTLDDAIRPFDTDELSAKHEQSWSACVTFAL